MQGATHAELPTTPSRALYPAELSRSLPHPRTLRSASPSLPSRLTSPTNSRYPHGLFLSFSLSLSLSLYCVSLRSNAFLRPRETPSVPHFTLSMCWFFLASAPVRRTVSSLVLIRCSFLTLARQTLSLSPSIVLGKSHSFRPFVFTFLNPSRLFSPSAPAKALIESIFLR